MKTAVVAAVLFGATSLVAQVPSTGRAVIAGRVIDDLGDPVIAARVTVERRTAAGGVAAVATADTDDRGEYRVPGLPAGSFLVAVLTIGGIGHKRSAPKWPGLRMATRRTLLASARRPRPRQ